MHYKNKWHISLPVVIFLLASCNASTNKAAPEKAAIETPNIPQDSPLTVSEVYGVDIMAVGDKERFFVDISDADGVESVQFVLKDQKGDHIKVIPHTKDKESYKISLDSTDILPGRYQLTVAAVGRDGGDGELSGRKVSALNLDIQKQISKAPADRF